ncbi:S-layer homology domain-containing protein [Cohnella soli]|uniref:S-layer homology domain-containing protein n=1 Tax=Cohnella soli TaxID=425005 RepID=A0ABW0I3C4_9BACL
MKAARKMFILLLAFLLMNGAIGPIKNANAAQINRFTLNDLETFSQASYLIAGKTYYPAFDSDAAFGTSMEGVQLEYTTNNGATWLSLPITQENGFFRKIFSLPIDPGLVSAKFRISAYFDPLIGSKTFSSKTIGPYPIMQPGDPSDLTATSSDDGIVTLRWQDNSNMESYYRITRAGPDGNKTFTVENTMDNIGPLTYVDKQTDKKKSTIYVYSVTPVIDKYNLPQDLRPGVIWAIVKTKVPISLADQIKIYSNLNVVIPDVVIPDLKSKIDSNTPIQKIDPFKYLVDFNLKLGDLDKKSVNDVKLNKKSVTLKPGESETLTATVMPSDAANPKMTWSSNNVGIAEVDNAGKVTAKAPGVANITVTSEMGNLKDVCIVTVLESAPTESPGMPAVDFKDLAGHKAAAEIAEAVKLGVVTGYPDGTFRPEGSVTRAEFASMIIRGLKPAEEGTPLAFKDKDKIPSWAVKPVQQAVKLGFLSGYPDGTFRPNAKVTHAEMISMVIRASGLATGNADATKFADDADIPKWAKPAVSKAEETGIIIVGGLPDGKFAPGAATTRAEAASAIVRMLKLPK